MKCSTGLKWVNKNKTFSFRNVKKKRKEKRKMVARIKIEITYGYQLFTICQIKLAISFDNFFVKITQIQVLSGDFEHAHGKIHV